jgi:FkbM family methyltransferase
MKRLRQRLHRLLRREERDIEYPCGACTIVLPAGHKLPEYQSAHPHYDRFLPQLARHVPAGTSIVDVGANVGDTVAAMAAAAPQAHYLCIEPDPTFFRYLENNVARIRAALPGIEISLSAQLVGRQLERAALESAGGTAHARPDSGGVASVTLDRIVADAGVAPVSLLKSDVDGFDYDVVDSASALIAAHEPLLFFECQPLEATQREGFRRLLPRLEAAGYSHWAAFDNFGQAMLQHSCTAAMIDQLIEYAWQQGRRAATRTIYYVDVLAATNRHAAIMMAALEGS